MSNSLVERLAKLTRPRIGWRFILPAIQTLLYVLLFLIEFHGKGEPWSVLSPEAVVLSFQEQVAIGWDPQSVRTLPGPAARIAYAINFPAAVVAAPLVGAGGLLFPSLLSYPYVPTGLIVPILWFWVGRWLDLRLGILPKGPSRPLPRWVQGLAGAAMVLLGLLGALCLFVALVGPIASQHGFSFLDSFGALIASAWCFFFALVLFEKVNGPRE